MIKIYVIGSMRSKKIIRKVAEFIKDNGNYEVDYVYPQRSKSRLQLIIECFDKIELADIVVAVDKKGKGIGEGTLYEMEYAERCNKKLFVTDGNDPGDLFLKNTVTVLMSSGRTG